MLASMARPPRLHTPALVLPALLPVLRARRVRR
jgi:hypothetical protein